MVEQLFKDILETQSYSGHVERMTSLIVQYARIFGADVRIDKNNVYVTKGEPTANGYPCIVSHTDTVHKIVSDDEYSVAYDEKHRIIYAYNPVKRDFTGVGGDDKVGIYIALAAIRDYTSMKACFFRDEEIGCVGSGEADLSFFSDCMYILQCDRRGNADFVNTIGGLDISSKAFQDDVLPIITKYGYSFHTGGITDVGKLTQRKVGVSSANMSCGYHNPHSSDEIISVDDVHNTMWMVYDIFNNLTNRYDHVVEEKVFTPYYGGKSNKFKDYDSWYEDSYVPVSYTPSYADTKVDGTNGLSYLDWYLDIPKAKDLEQMDFEDVFLHAALVILGWEAAGDFVYRKKEDKVTVYKNMWEFDVLHLESLLSQDAQDEAFEFADYCITNFQELVEEQKSCVCCGKDISDVEHKKHDGNCIVCFNAYNQPVLF